MSSEVLWSKNAVEKRSDAWHTAWNPCRSPTDVNRRAALQEPSQPKDKPLNRRSLETLHRI